jgi:hypothetical protein
VVGTRLLNTGPDLQTDYTPRRAGNNNPFKRALVHGDNDTLHINFAGDYSGGVQVDGSPETSPVNVTISSTGVAIHLGSSSVTISSERAAIAGFPHPPEITFSWAGLPPGIGKPPQSNTLKLLQTIFDLQKWLHWKPRTRIDKNQYNENS